MNTANLQLEGLCLAIASINKLMLAKGLVSQDELLTALRTASAVSASSERATEDLSPANRDAITFPIRMLELAAQMPSEAPLPDFATLARRVGETKGRYNDQQ